MYKRCAGTALLVAFLTSAESSYAQPSPKEWAQNITVEDFTWELGGFNTVLILKTIRLKNRANVTLKDFRIVCETFAASGTRLSKVTHTLYETVGPLKTRTFRGVSMGLVNSQSKRGNCEVTRAEA